MNRPAGRGNTPYAVWRIAGANGLEAIVHGPYTQGQAVRLAEQAGVEKGSPERVADHGVWVWATGGKGRGE